MALVTSVSALYMIWTRETFGGILMNDIGVSLNAVLIMVFAAMTLRYAMARKIAVHQRWALRTFMVVSGVWYLRVMYAFLAAMPGTVPGIAGDMTGPTNVALNFAEFHFEYTPQEADNSAGSSIPMGWSIAKNAEAS